MVIVIYTTPQCKSRARTSRQIVLKGWLLCLMEDFRSCVDPLAQSVSICSKKILNFTYILKAYFTFLKVLLFGVFKPTSTTLDKFSAGLNPHEQWYLLIPFLFYLFHFPEKALDPVQHPQVPGLCLIFVGPYLLEEFDTQKLPYGVDEKVFHKTVSTLSTELLWIDLTLNSILENLKRNWTWPADGQRTPDTLPRAVGCIGQHVLYRKLKHLK